jgi:hypothetical protein
MARGLYETALRAVMSKALKSSPRSRNVEDRAVELNNDEPEAGRKDSDRQGWM